MGLGIAFNLEAALGDLRHGVGRRGLDPVHLATEQSSGAGIGLGHGQHHDAVELGHALGIPIGFVGHHLQALARHKARHLERARTRCVSGKRRPGSLGLVGRGVAGGGVKFLFPMRGRGHEQIGQVQGQEGIGFAGGQLNRQLVNLAGAAQGGHARSGHAHLAGVKVNGIFVQHFLHVPDNRIGVDGRTVMELDAGAQFEGPLGFVGGIHRPRGGQAGDQHAGGIGLGQVPLRQCVVHRDAGEAVAFKTLIGLTQGAGNVGGGHGNAQHLFLRLHGQAHGAQTDANGQGHGRRRRGAKNGEAEPFHENSIRDV